MSSLMCYTKIASLIVGTGTIISFMYWLSGKFLLLRKFRLVGVVSGLHCYPVSACSGMVNYLATCTFRGLKMIGAYDVQFIVGRETDETFAVSSPIGTVKQYFSPSMRQIQALCNGSDLLLSTPDGDMFTLPLKQRVHNANVIHLHCAENIVAVVDLGDVVAGWLIEKLETPKLRLYQVISQVVCVTPGRSTFGNYIFAVQDSVDYVNKIVSMVPRLTTQYFRPNIILSGCSPLDENNWSYIRIGKVLFEVSCPDSRIISTNSCSDNLDWKPSWEFPPKVPKNIKVIDGFNFTADLGVNAKVLIEGEVNVGDPVYIAY